MLFAAATFGETVTAPDWWSLVIGTAIPLLVGFFKSRFPALQWLWDIVAKLGSPSPVPPPAPPDSKPDTGPATGGLADLVKKLLELLAKRKQQTDEEKAALAAVAEALKS
jgi:hypothetical protein